MTINKFAVKTGVFEGPLDVLLNLIEKRKLLINDISLAKVTDDFIAYVKELKNFPIADTAHFILIASTLLLIKSRSLLPSLELSEEEKGDIASLELRLKLYQRSRELTEHIKTNFGRNSLFALNPKPVEPVFSPENSMNRNNILSAIKSVLAELPKIQSLPKAIVKKVISLEDMITRLTDRITNSLKMSFRDFAGIGKSEKVHVVVSFLALLELVKQGLIEVRQDHHFEDIQMESGKLSTPSYQ